MTHFVLTRLDASKETSHTSIKTDDIAVDGSNWAAIVAGLVTVQAGFAGVSNGNAYNEAIQASSERLTNVVPTDDSRREAKWLATVEDDVTKKTQFFTAPCADWTNVNRAGVTDFWDMGDETSQMTAFRVGIETNMISEAGNNVTMLSVEDVGRNN